MFKSYFPENIQGNAVMIFFPVQLKSFVHDFFFILNLFFFLSIFMIKYTQGKKYSLLQKLKENCQINFIVPLSYKASSKLMAHNSTTNEKRRKAIFKSVIKSQ